MHEQARGVHGFPLDAVCPAGVGTPVLPADREHRQAPVAHLGMTRDDPGARAGTPGGDAPRPRLSILPPTPLPTAELPALLGLDEKRVSPLSKTSDINKPTHALLLDAKGKEKKIIIK